MRVGLDLDGVVFDYVQNTREIAKRVWPTWDKAEGRLVEFKFDAPSTCWDYPVEDWGMSWEEFKYLNKYGMDHGLLFTGPIVTGMKTLVDNLVAKGHTIHIVTHRSIPGAISATDRWLREHELPYHSLTFVHDAGDKSYTDLDVLIDDKVENIEAWTATGRPGILYRQKWNDHYIGDAYVANFPEEVEDYVTQIDGMRRLSEAFAASPTTESALEEAQRLVHGDRGRDYGHPIDDFTRTGRIWGAILGTGDISPELVGLCMIGVKISREVNAPKRDNRVDAAGYAETVEMIRQRQEATS